MVTANLNGLKQYVCERPVGGDGGSDLVKAYPFKGDVALGIKPGDVAGIDRDGDGRLDFFVGVTDAVLNRFVLRSNALAARTEFGAWGPSVSVPLKQLPDLTRHCQKWDEQNKVGQKGILAIATGAAFGIGGVVGVFTGSAAGLTAPFLIAGVLLIGFGIFMYHSVNADLESDVSQKTFQSLKSVFKSE